MISTMLLSLLATGSINFHSGIIDAILEVQDIRGESVSLEIKRPVANMSNNCGGS